MVCECQTKVWKIGKSCAAQHHHFFQPVSAATLEERNILRHQLALSSRRRSVYVRRSSRSDDIWAVCASCLNRFYFSFPWKVISFQQLFGFVIFKECKLMWKNNFSACVCLINLAEFAGKTVKDWTTNKLIRLLCAEISWIQIAEFFSRSLLTTVSNRELIWKSSNSDFRANKIFPRRKNNCEVRQRKNVIRIQFTKRNIFAKTRFLAESLKFREFLYVNKVRHFIHSARSQAPLIWFALGYGPTDILSLRQSNVTATSQARAARCEYIYMGNSHKRVEMSRGDR